MRRRETDLSVTRSSNRHECSGAGWKSESGRGQRSVASPCRSYCFRRRSGSLEQGRWSRSCSGSFRYPSPQGSVGTFIEAIAAFVRARPGTLLLPMTEATTLPVSAHREFLIAAGARLILPDHCDLLRAFNKNETTRLAASLGVAVPKTLVVTSAEEASSAANPCTILSS